jgi:prephenate dehydratase
MKISIQGEKGCFHEVAARDYFKDEVIEIVPCTTFDQTLMAVRENQADFAIIAIENARSGSILHNYTLVRESGMKILGEINLRVKQNLMALPGQTIMSIREIRSHPIALSQCMTYLNHLRGVVLVEADDTAGAARIISENQLKGVAAIAPSAAAEIYGLEIIAPGIETYKKNYTRFIILGSDVLPPDINPDHWPWYWSSLPSWISTSQRSSRFQGLMVNGNICFTSTWN